MSSKNTLALKALFEDADPVRRLPYEQFLNKPKRKMSCWQEITAPSNVTDPDSQPFGNLALIKALGYYVSKVNRLSNNDDQIHFHIHDIKGHKITIYADHIIAINRARESILEILSGHAEGKLADIKIKDLIEETLRKAEKPTPLKTRTTPDSGKAVLTPERLVELYLAGRAVEHLDSDETQIIPGRITFDESLHIHHFEGQRRESYKKLKSFLRARLNVSVKTSEAGYYAEIEGPKDQAYLAYLIGIRAAPMIDEGKKSLSKVWLNNFYADAKFRLATEKAEAIKAAEYRKANEEKRAAEMKRFSNAPVDPSATATFERAVRHSRIPDEQTTFADTIPAFVCDLVAAFSHKIFPQ